MGIILVISVLVLLGVICYQIQKRIGEEQERDWAEYRKAHSHAPKAPATGSHHVGNPGEKKFIEEMWARHAKYTRDDKQP